jgi:hypothetical protein
MYQFIGRREVQETAVEDEWNIGGIGQSDQAQDVIKEAERLHGMLGNPSGGGEE